MGLCRFSYPSDKLLLVSSLYPSRGEKVESQRRENLSLSLFPSFPIRLVLRSGVVNVVASLAHSDRVVTGDWAENGNAWLIPRPNAQISFCGRLDNNGGFFLIEGYSYRKCHP